MEGKTDYNKYLNNEVGRDSLNLRAELEKYISYWKFFTVCLILSFAISFLVVRYSTPVFSASTTIMIKDNQKSGISTELEAFKDLGIIGGGSANNPDNEIEILKSRRLIGKVVDSLGLNVSYLRKGRLITSEIYKTVSPFQLTILNNDSNFRDKDTIFKIQGVDNNKFLIIPLDGDKGYEFEYGELITSSIGTFRVDKNLDYTKFNESESLNIYIRGFNKVVDNYRGRLSIEPVNKNSSVLVLTIKDIITQKALDVLNEIVKQYNLDAIRDKSEVSAKTKAFIDERLLEVGRELALIDDSVKKYKRDKNFTGNSTEVNLILNSLASNNQRIVELKTQLSLAEWVLKQLKKDTVQFDVLPTNLGFEESSITQSIIEYNSLVIERDRKIGNSGKLNPVLIQLNSKLNIIKGSLIKSVSNVRNSIELQLRELRKEERKIADKVASIPLKERGFIDIARQQEIITEFYSYLLKKKEETDLSLAVTVPNAKIIDVAYSSNIPVSPKKNIIYLAALLLGLLVPFVIIYIKDLLDTKVHSKKDIEDQLSIPFLGDIPTDATNEKVVVGSGVRSSTAEAFRLIRTNLDFMLANKRKESKSIFITSTTSGEGKSFISINLAATLAFSGSKVVLVGMDLRAPKIIEYLGLPERKWLTNYITDHKLTLDEIKFTIPEVKGLDIISSGVVPPNPAELLMTKRIDNLFTILREDYDFVIVDTAPVNLVTDTLLISKYADMFVYTVRANYLDKRLLAVPKNLYNEERLPNMAIILNDTDPKKAYGYGSGYVGYGYGYVEVEKPWYKKLFGRS